MVSKKPISRNPSLKKDVRGPSEGTLEDGCHGVLEHWCWWSGLRTDVHIAGMKAFSAVEWKWIVLSPSGFFSPWPHDSGISGGRTGQAWPKSSELAWLSPCLNMQELFYVLLILYLKLEPLFPLLLILVKCTRKCKNEERLLEVQDLFCYKSREPSPGIPSPMASQNTVGGYIGIFTFPFYGSGRLKSVFKYLHIYCHVYSASSSLIAPNVTHHIFHPFWVCWVAAAYWFWPAVFLWQSQSNYSNQ